MDRGRLNQFRGKGQLPKRAKLLREGESGTLRTLHPPLSPIVWTTMMTGRGPLDHGVLDFTRFDPGTGLRVPIGSGDRRVPAVWNVVSFTGRDVAVFGMWATYPAETVRGIVVSDRLMSFQNGAHASDRGVVAPEAQTSWARESFARAQSAVGDGAPSAYGADFSDAPELLAGLRRVLVETAVYDDLASSWFREHHPDLTILYVQGTDAIGHLFAPYRPPRMNGISQRDVERFGRIADVYYEDVDRRLGAWRLAAREAGATLVLVSDHGFAWGDDRPDAAGSAAAATAGRWHRDDGIYVVAAPWRSTVETARGHGNVIQVAPTLLALLGIVPDRRMTEPLAGIVPTAGPAADYSAAFETRAASEPLSDGTGAGDSIESLRALGYIGAAEPDRAARPGPSGTRTAGSYCNEGLILLDAGRTKDAKAAFGHALEVDPRHAASLFNLAHLLAAESDPTADATLLRALEAGSPDAARLVGSRARRRLEAGDCRSALSDARALARADARSAVAPAAEGLALLCLGERVAAAAALRRSLAIDPDQPEIVRALEVLPR